MLDVQIDDTGPQTALHGLERFGDGAPVWRLPASSSQERVASLAQNLTHYIEGWAQAEAAKIVQAVSPDYLFVDPLVGSFDRETLSDYMAILKQRVGFKALATYPRKICLQRMASVPPRARLQQFWRSIPELGLAGPSEIQVSGERVCKEVVCYELNVATEQLRQTAQNPQLNR